MVRISNILALCLLTIVGFSQEYKLSPVKTSLSEGVFSPVYYADGIVLCGTQIDNVFKATRNETSGDKLTDLYYLKNDSKKAELFDKTFKTDFYDGPISFNADETKAFISQNIDLKAEYKLNEDSVNLLGVFYRERIGDKWTERYPLPCNGIGYSCTHPAATPKGDQVIISSNMPGGYGGYDLYIMNFKNGSWSDPVNLGKNINTEHDELFPGMIGNHTLSFSRNIETENTGLDIYYSKIKNGGFTKAYKFSNDLNSDYDDFGLASRDGLRSGYITSNRLGIDEIFEFEMEHPEFEACDTIVPLDFCFTLYEEHAAKLETVEIVYQWSINDVKLYGVEVDYCFPGPGIYDISLDLIDTVIDKTFFNQASYQLELERQIQVYIESPDTLLLGELGNFNASKSHLPDMEVDDFYWDFGNGENQKGELVEYSYPERGKYRVQVGAIGLDGSQSCAYKDIICLTDEDLLFVQNNDVDLFASNDKSKKKKEKKNKKGSETVSLTDENSDVSTSITDIADELFDVEETFMSPIETDSVAIFYSIEILKSVNRLQEGDPLMVALEPYIEDLRMMEEEELYTYVIGNWPSISESLPLFRELDNLGFEDAVVRSFEVEITNNTSDGEILNFDDIQFDSGDWRIKKDAIPRLEVVLEALGKYPEWNLIIEAHTDNEANDEFNMTLSERRAESVKNWLVKQGIDEDRLESYGYGESKPIETNDTAEGKRLNRRVVFKLNRVFR